MLEKITVFFLILLFSFFTIVCFAPTHLHADVIMFSIMSEQNLTLFYWGQDRLLNVIPLLAFPIQNPRFNLYAILFFSAFSWYTLLYIASRLSLKVLKISFLKPSCLFFIASTIFLLLFTDKTIFDIVLGQHEYSLSLLFLLLSCINMGVFWSTSNFRKVMAVFLCFLSVMLNPSTLILCLMIVGSVALYNKKISIEGMLLVVGAIVSAILWKSFAGSGYTSWSLSALVEGCPKSLAEIVASFNAVPAVFLVLLLCLSELVFFDKLKSYCLMKTYLTKCCVIFSCGWLFTFAGNSWVRMNVYCARYFFYILFAFLFLLMIRVCVLFAEMRGLYRRFVLFVCVILCVSVVILAPNKQIDFEKYAVFQKINVALAPTQVTEHGTFYAGDYWYVWPAVQRDLMRGYTAYGLTQRGEGNPKTRQTVKEQYNNQGYVEIYCVNSKEQACLKGIRSTLVDQQVTVLASTQKSELVNVLEIKVEQK